MSPHASLSLPFECVSLSLSLQISSHPPVCLSQFMLHYCACFFVTCLYYSHDFDHFHHKVSPKNWITNKGNSWSPSLYLSSVHPLCLRSDQETQHARHSHQSVSDSDTFDSWLSQIKTTALIGSLPATHDVNAENMPPAPSFPTNVPPPLLPALKFTLWPLQPC